MVTDPATGTIARTEPCSECGGPLPESVAEAMQWLYGAGSIQSNGLARELERAIEGSHRGDEAAFELAFENWTNVQGVDMAAAARHWTTCPARTGGHSDAA